MTRISSFEVIVNSAPVEAAQLPFERAPLDRDHGDRDPAQWHQAVGVARQACARIFRDGGSATDAIRAFGLAAPDKADWSRAVTFIAESLCRPQMRRAA
jgi:hypothetical protein